jgi:phospholipid transport system substrate-binding protein
MTRYLQKNNLNRRIFLGSAASALMVPANGFTMTTYQATDLVLSVVSEINKVISSGQSEQSMMRSFENIFDSFGDVQTIARYALGREARSLSGTDMKGFTNAFKVYVSHKYGSRFREFIGGQIDVKSSRKVKQFFEVKAKVVIKNRDPLELIFLVSDKSGEPLFFNIYVEGINLLLTERGEIGALMDRNGGDIKATIKKLNKSF